MAKYGHLSTDKTAQETRADIREVFRKWPSVDDFEVVPPRKNADFYERYRARVEFWFGGNKQVLECNRFAYYQDNLRAIWQVLDALRKADQRGILVELARTAVAMLPPGEVRRPWFEVLEVSPSASPEVVDAAYRSLAKRRHPDAGGSEEAMRELNEAKAEFDRLAAEGAPA